MKHAASNYSGGVAGVARHTLDPHCDLFAFADRYPFAPAARATETSRAAAERVKSRVESLRQRCLDYLTKAASRATGGMTADELATALRESVLTIRPRVAELHAAGKIADGGLRRPNASGHKAIVWVAVGGGREQGAGSQEKGC